MAKGTSKKADTPDFVADRQKKFDQMFKKIAANDDLRKQFSTKPDAVAAQFNITLSDEEIFVAKTLKNVDVDTLRQRLKGDAVALFNNNCGCGGFTSKGAISKAAVSKAAVSKKDILQSW